MPKLVDMVPEAALAVALGEGWGICAALDRVRPPGRRLVSREVSGELSAAELLAQSDALRRRVAAAGRVA